MNVEVLCVRYRFTSALFSFRYIFPCMSYVLKLIDCTVDLESLYFVNHMTFTSKLLPSRFAKYVDGFPNLCVGSDELLKVEILLSGS